MADLNGGHGKFQGVDENVKYAASFVGATKVAEKVKKGGTESKSDGYVVDAIDIDWGGLKLTTIADNWSYGLQTASSTEQNAGKGDNTKGIHSTAYLLNKISSSFTQIYNEIGGNDDAGLRKKIKDLEISIKEITGSNPGQLTDIRDRIQKIEKELDNPGAANTLVTILDTLDGFNKNKKGDVKNYIDVHDQAILGSTTDAATAYTVYGVRKYVDTTAKNSLLGKAGDEWPNKHTIYGVAKYAEDKASTSYNNAIIAANEYTNQAIGTAESTLIGSTADAATANTIWGAKNYANTTVKNSLLGKSGDAWPTKQTLYGVVKYSDTKNGDLKTNLIGTSTDTTIDTHYGLKHILIGKSADASTADTIWGAKNYAQEQAIQARSDAREDAKDYVDTTARDRLIGTPTDKTIDTHYGLKHILIGKSSDAPTADTIWGAKNYANTTVKNSLLGATSDQWPTKQTIWGVKNSLIGTASDHDDSNTIWGAKNYAKNQISVKKYNQLTARVIEESGEGILELLTVSSYLG